jgi:hypothetical protein
LVDEQEFLEKFPVTDNLNREVVMENFAKQLSVMRAQESNAYLWKPDINSGNTCEETRLNECNSTVFGK